MYSIAGVWLLSTFPNSFTLGEASIVSQGATMLVLDTGLQVVHLVSFQIASVLLLHLSTPVLMHLKLDLVSLADFMTPHRPVSLLYVEVSYTLMNAAAILQSLFLTAPPHWSRSLLPALEPRPLQDHLIA